MVRVAYLVNRYPAVSHSFIRREIAGLEAAGLEVDRYSIRRSAGPLPDPADQAELPRTDVVLAAGVAPLLGAVLAQAAHRPRAFIGAVRLAIAMAMRARGKPISHLAYLVEAAWLVRALRRTGATHLHAHFGTNPAAVARLVHVMGGPPYSFTVHGPDEFDEPGALDLHGKIADASVAVAISHFGVSQLMRWSDPSDWWKIAVVRCGVDETFLDATAPPSTAPVLISVCRLAPQKGLPLMVEAAAHLAAEGRDFTLRVIGEGPMREELERTIAERGLRSRLQLVGARDAAGVRDELIAARAMMLPSLAEGLPVVFMEALGLGRPVIASAIAGTPELVDDECGWLIPAGSVDALVDAMRSALDASAEELAAKGAVGAARVRAAHDSHANAAKLAEMFRTKSLPPRPHPPRLSRRRPRTPESPAPR